MEGYGRENYPLFGTYVEEGVEFMERLDPEPGTVIYLDQDIYVIDCCGKKQKRSQLSRAFHNQSLGSFCVTHFQQSGSYNHNLSTR